MAMTLVSTVTVGSGGAASIEFTNIPQTGKDLLLLTSLRRDDGTYNSGAYLQINGTSSTIYPYRTLTGIGSSVSSSSDNQPTGVLFYANGNTSTSNTFSNSGIYISSYASAVKSSISVDLVTENNDTNARQFLSAALHDSASAITSLSVTNTSGNFVQHSTASLYIIS